MRLGLCRWNSCCRSPYAGPACIKRHRQADSFLGSLSRGRIMKTICSDSVSGHLGRRPNRLAFLAAWITAGVMWSLASPAFANPQAPDDDIKPADLCPLPASVCSIPGKVEAVVNEVKRGVKSAVEAVTPSKPLAPTLPEWKVNTPLATRLAEVESCVKDDPSHEQARAWCQERVLTEAEIRKLAPSSGRTNVLPLSVATQSSSVAAVARVPLPLSAIAASSPECRPVIARFMRFDPENLTARNLAAIDTVEKGWSEMVLPGVASSSSPQDIQAALTMTDERVARERPGPGGMARYEYVKCIYQNRLNQLSGTPSAKGGILTRANITGRAAIETSIAASQQWELERPAREARERAQLAANAERYRQDQIRNEQFRLKIEAQDRYWAERDRRTKESGNSFFNALGAAVQAIAGAQSQGQSTYVPPKSTYVPPTGQCIASAEICRQIETGRP